MYMVANDLNHVVLSRDLLSSHLLGDKVGSTSLHKTDKIQLLFPHSLRQESTLLWKVLLIFHHGILF